MSIRSNALESPLRRRNPSDWNSRVKALLTGSNSVWLGSVEGVHHSRALYNYIRVVRVKEPAVTPIPRD